MKTTEVCPAQRAAGFNDGGAKEAIDFCTNKCPYPDCVLTITKPNPTMKRRSNRKNRALELESKGFTIRQTSLIMRLSERTIQKYLNEERRMGNILTRPEPR